MRGSTSCAIISRMGKGERIIGTGCWAACPRAGRCADAHRAGQHVALRGHRHELEGDGDGHHGAIAVRHQSRDRRTGADAAQAADDANWGALSSAPGITMDRNSVAAPSAPAA